MQNNNKYLFLIIFYQNSIWYMIFIGVWIIAVFQAALHNLETYCETYKLKHLHTEFNILNNAIENGKSC